MRGGYVEGLDIKGDQAVEDMFNTIKSRIAVSLLTSLEDLARFLGSCQVVLNLASRKAQSD